MSDIENSDEESSFASDVEEETPGYRAGAIAKKKAAPPPPAKKAATPGEESDVDDESTVADDDDDDDGSAVGATAADDSEAEDDDSAAADDDDDDDIDKQFNDNDDEDEQEVGRNIPVRFELNEQDNDDEDEDDYMAKFDENTRKNVIEEFYPELIQQNYEEIETLTTVIRDKDGFIVDPLHTTLPILSKYEKTRILGERARQIGTGAPTLIDVDDDIIDPYLIALKELEAKKVPFIIKRPLPNGIEYWKVSDLEII